MPQNMGIGRVGSSKTVHKLSHRWMIEISPFIGHDLPALPPHKGARPDISFNEMKADHLVETITFPGRPEWGTLDISVFDIIDCEDERTYSNVIFDWLKKLYNPNVGTYKPSLDSPYKIGNVTLKLFDGCGQIIEQWRYDNVWPTKIQWNSLDMSSAEVLMVDLTLKYDRAYIYNANESADGSNGRSVEGIGNFRRRI